MFVTDPEYTEISEKGRGIVGFSFVCLFAQCVGGCLFVYYMVGILLEGF